MAAERSCLTAIAQALCPDRSRANVSFILGERRDVRRTTRRLFQRDLQPWEYAGLAGAPDDAEVEVGTLDGGVYLDVFQPATNRYRAVQLVKPADAGPFLVIEALRIHNAMRRQGLGLRIFTRQLTTANALGVGRIETTAGRSLHENGYYTWPRFGFDGPLPPEIKRRLPRGLDHADTVLDLMEYEKGRLWWKAHGVVVHLAFDLVGRSRSWSVFARYLGRKRPAAEAAAADW
jgi:GNAT superfamily N-acetyltransferase